jgi:hypothetical protein
MVVMFQVEVFWVVMPCNVVVGYQWFRGLLLHITWHDNPEGLNVRGLCLCCA